MGKIRQSIPRALLIPAMLDAHFPLLRWAFESPAWHAEILTEQDGIADMGLRYVHNDLCYPCILIAGQILLALRSGRYDLQRTAVMLPQAGDACRGSNYIRILRRALDKAGYSQVPLLSLNVRGIDRDTGLGITLAMVRRALAAVIWGDALLLTCHQTAPYAAVPGSTEALRDSWLERLAADLQANRNLSASGISRRCQEIAADFRALPRVARSLQKVAIVGELYIKYCRLGNWNLEDYLQSHGCEVCVNGFSWYVLYYMDTHLDEGPLWQRLGFRLLLHYVAQVQQHLLTALTKNGFSAMPPFARFKRYAAGLAPLSCGTGDGWLITAEAANWVLSGCHKVVCGQPFGCLPSHVCGRGLYAALQRKLPQARLVSVDFDASGSDVMVKSRVQLVLDDVPLPPAS